jgi:4-nitrophenyl phosphatase
MTIWALDLDGVIWTGTHPIPGAAEAVDQLRRAGHQVVFVTNNSFATIAEQEAKLASFGIEAAGSVITSAQAGASLVAPKESVFVLGGPGVREAVAERGAEVVDVERATTADAVLVGLDWDLSYDRLRAAVQAVLGGARFIATNTDPTYPTERGLFPGAGSLVAAVAEATGTTPIVAGKPHRPQAELVRARYGTDGVMVGDRPDTDGHFAAALGYRFGLVLSGVTSVDDLPVDPEPAHVADDLAALVELVLGPAGPG